MKKIIFSVMIITVISKVLGFVRDIVLSYFYGAGSISDAYLISMTIPRVIFSLIGAAIAITFIPVYSELLKLNSKKANIFTNNLINFLFIFISIITAIALFFTEPLVSLFASGFDESTLNVAVMFTKVSIFSIYFNALVYVFQAYLRVHKRFKTASVIGLPFNVIIIISIVLAAKFNVIFLAIGILIAFVFQFIIILPAIYKCGFRYKIYINFKDKKMIKMLSLSLPVVIGNSVNQINILVDRTLASRITVGGISALNYASRLTGFIDAIIVLSVVNVMYSLISESFANKNFVNFKKYINDSITIIFLFVIPATIGFVIFAKEIVTLLFGRGEFNDFAINITATALIFYSLGMVGIGLRRVLSNVFYSMHNTKTPMINAAIGMIVNIIMNLLFYQSLGLKGLALATSISAIFTSFLLYLNLRKTKVINIKPLIIVFFKISLASVCMAVVSIYLFNYLVKLSVIHSSSAMFVSIFTGFFVYTVCIYLFRIKEVREIIGIIKKSVIKKEV